MPRKSTASKSIATAPKAPRKTRTRKTSTKPVAKVTTVRTLKSVKRPSTARLISPQRYLQDIKTRWAIHNYEITMLVSDFSKVVTFVTPYHTQLVKQVKAWTVWKLTFFVTTALHTPFFCAWSFRLSIWTIQLWTSFFPLYFKRDTLREKSASHAKSI